MFAHFWASKDPNSSPLLHNDKNFIKLIPSGFQRGIFSARIESEFGLTGRYFDLCGSLRGQIPHPIETFPIPQGQTVLCSNQNIRSPE